MRRRHCTRQFVLLMRNTLGRFTRIRATLAEMARTVRPRRRTRHASTVIKVVQLTLF